MIFSVLWAWFGYDRRHVSMSCSANSHANIEHTHMYVYIYTHIWTSTHTHVYIHTHTHVNLSVPSDLVSGMITTKNLQDVVRILTIIEYTHVYVYIYTHIWTSSCPRLGVGYDHQEESAGYCFYSDTYWTHTHVCIHTHTHMNLSVPSI